MKSLFKYISLVAVLLTLLSGCALLGNAIKNWESAFEGLDAVYTSYDEDANIIDRIEANSILISAEDAFAKRDSEGNSVGNSGVLNLTVGGKTVLHVGSSAIIHEKSLNNMFEEFAKTVDITNTDKSVPFLSKMAAYLRNKFTGDEYIILVRSQTGKPLATFVGRNVSYFATPVDKSTGILIDGKLLFIYRCDYLIAPLELL